MTAADRSGEAGSRRRRGRAPGGRPSPGAQPSAMPFPSPSAILAALLAAAIAAPPAAAGIRFREVAAEWGVDFRHVHGGTGDFYMIETMGSGVAAFDYDGDGDDDLLFVQSGELPTAAERPHRTALYRNDGGRFVDVSAAAGVEVDIYGMGVTAGDVDDDGDPDLYLTAFGRNRLLRNDGDGGFTDVTAAAGVGDPLWGASAAFADVDRDGDLDLYVTNYVDFDFADNPPCGLKHLGLRSYCHPDVYDGLPDRFFRNRGDGTFEEATGAAGFGGADGKGLGVIFGDLDRDGWTDLYVANDMTANFLFHNRGDGTFEDVALTSGVAFDERGDAEAGMGVALGDLDDNGFFDILVTHLDGQTTALYSNTGAGLYVDSRYTSRIAEPSFRKVGFGIALGDFDRDGREDAAFANGHIIHNVELWGTSTTYRQPNQVMRNLGGGRFEEVDAGLEELRVSRGLATADLDLDGDLDLAISNSDDRAEIHANVTTDAGGWLGVEIAGEWPAAGTLLELRAGELVERRELRTASSYMSQSSAVAHFGLGEAARVDRLELTLPDGSRRRLLDLPADHRLRIRNAE